VSIPLKTFGATGVQVPVIGQGTWQMESAPRDSVAALRAGIEAGATHIDTAEIYGDGEVERLVGAAIKGQRERVFLVSKVDPAHASRAGVVRACEASLKRLGTDRLDCYLLHWESSFPLAETFAGFEDLVAAKKIRHWGVSNFREALLGEAVRVAGPGRIACNQVKHHLNDRRIERALVPLCERHQIAVVGYSPFGQGRFVAPGSPGGRVLADVAAELEATPRQVTLAFLLHTSRGFVIPKSSRAEHVAENVGAAGLTLDEGIIERIDRAFR
jgi:diketogulonate reductase-like aldo/keto reductase